MRHLPPTLALLIGLVVSTGFASHLGAFDETRSATMLRDRAPEAASKRDIQEWVDAYCSNEGDVPGSLKSLRAVPPTKLTDPIERRLKSSKTRERALSLAAELRVPGLYKRAKPYVDDFPETAVPVLLVSGDKGADEHLVERWFEAAPDSALFRAIDQGFRAHFLEPPAIRDLHERATDEDAPAEHAAATAAILRYQLALGEISNEKLHEDFPRLFEEFARKAVRFRVRGEELLARPGWVAGFGGAADESDGEEGDGQVAPASFPPEQATRFREKVIVERQGSLRLPKITEKNCTVRFRVMVLEGEGGGLGVLMKGNSMVGPRIDGGEWLVQASIRQGTAPVKVGEWSELVCQLNGTNLAVTLDGRLLASTVHYGDAINGLMVTGGNGRVLVGSVELQR